MANGGIFGKGGKRKGIRKTPRFFRVNSGVFFGGVCFVCCFFQNMVRKTNKCVEHAIQNGDVFLFLFYS